MKINFKIIMLILVFTFIIACNSVSVYAAGGPIKIGLVGIMTGPNAENGEYCRNGANMAIEAINENGGVMVPGEGKKLIELVVEDDQATPDVGMNAIRKLLNEHKVIAFLGPDYSSITYPSLFLSEEAKVPQITSSISSKITKEGYNYIFRGRSNADDWVIALIDYLVTDKNIKTIGISYTNIELGKNGALLAEKYMKEKYGLEPALVVSHSFGDKDLSASAYKIKQVDPEALINWGTQIEASLLLKVLRQVDWKGVFGFNAADEIFVALARDNAIGVLGPQNWIYTLDNEESQKFANEYRERYGRWPSPHSIVYYDGINLLKAAIETVGTDSEKIRDFIAEQSNFKVVQGVFEPKNLEGGEMITTTVIIEYDEDLIPQIVKVTK